MNWLLHVTGIDNVSGRWYAFWSGIAGELSWVGIPVLLYRRNNCHVRGCWRLGKHSVDDTPWVVCRRHHPDLPARAPRAEELAEQARSDE